MTIIRYVTVVLLVTLLGYGQVSKSLTELSCRPRPKSLSGASIDDWYLNKSKAFPTPKRMKVISPYLSNSLIHRINQARACHDDWLRLHPKNDEKAPSTWFEFGLFSGPDDRGHPQAFQVEKTESDEDGSFRVYVRLTEGPQEKQPWNWQVAVVVMSRRREICNQ